MEFYCWSLKVMEKLKFGLIDYLPQMKRPGQCKIERSN